MSKKELVKQVIDDLIKEGRDFYEITQGTLSSVNGLEDVSKTTIKRAKNEYKKEKIVVQSNYKETLIKRKIYKYLDRYPRTSLSELREALPDIPPAKASEYHQFWKRKRERSKTKGNEKPVVVNPRKLKEMVFSYLSEHQNVTSEQLFRAFPDANKSSVSSYFGHWKKKQASHSKGKEGSLFQVIFRYLDQNPEVGIDELKRAFTDVPRKSIEVYFNLWVKKKEKVKTAPVKQQSAANNSFGAKQGRSFNQSRKEKKDQNKMTIAAEGTSAVIADSPMPKKALKQQQDKSTVFPGKVKTDIAESAKKQDTISVSASESGPNNELIKNLKQTIEKQKITLTALEVEYSMLKDNQPEILKDFDTMTPNELKDVKEFITTYLNGMKKHQHV